MRTKFFEETKLGARPKFETRPKFGTKPILGPKVRARQVLEYAPNVISNFFERGIGVDRKRALLVLKHIALVLAYSTPWQY